MCGKINGVVDNMRKERVDCQKNDQKKFINPFEVLSYFKLLILVLELCDAIPLKTLEDQKSLFSSFEKISLNLLECLGFSYSDNVVAST